MKKLKLKILLTNISRVIRSVIFINLSNIVLGMNKVFGAIDINTIKVGDVSCYSAKEMTMKEQIRYFLQENVFILLVPIVLIIITIIFARKKIKENKKIKEEAKKRMEEKNDKQD